MKSFFNYTKNRLLYSILKFFVFLLIAYLLANCINIQTVKADSEPLLCDSKGGKYDFNSALLTINSTGSTPDKILYNAYLDAYNRMYSSYGWSKYFVSLSVAEPKNSSSENYEDRQAQSFTFTFFYNTSGSWYYESGTSLTYYRIGVRKYWSYTYKYVNDTYVYSSSDGNVSYSGSAYTNYQNVLTIKNDSCSVNPLMLFAGNINFKPTSYNSINELYYPIYNSDKYSHLQVIGQNFPYITDTWIPEINSTSYKELSLDTADFLVLWPKDKTAKDYTMYYKGMVCPTAVYNYGTLANTDNANRCTIDYSTFTKSTFSVIQSDIDNNAIYYFKGYKKGASIKINVSDWNYKFIYYDQDHTLTIDGTTYELLNYTEKDLPNNAVTNEKNNVVPGSSDNFFDNVLDGVRALFRSITSFFDSFFSSFLNVLSGLFLPPDGYMDNFVTSLKVSVEDKLGLLIYPFQFFVNICNRIINFNPTNTSGTIHIPEVKDPFYGVTLIEPQVLVLSDIFNTGSLKIAYNTYLYIVDLYLIFGFLNLCYKKFYEFICSNPVGGDNT